MFHYWLQRERITDTTNLYLQSSKIGLKDCLQLIKKDVIINFRSVGGYDENSSWMEHTIIENNAVRTGNPSWALEIYDMKTTPVAILERLHEIPFEVHQFGFECSDGLWITGESRTGQPFINIAIPIKDEEEWINRIGDHFPFVKVIPDWHQPLDNYYVADQNGLRAIFPGVKVIFDFHEKEIFAINQSFNQNLD